MRVEPLADGTVLVRVSARAVLDALGGISEEERLGHHDLCLPLFRALRDEHRSIVSIRLERSEFEDDDWVLFEFREAGPAQGGVRTRLRSASCVAVSPQFVGDALAGVSADDHLRQMASSGRLITAARTERHEDADWIVFQFGEPDAAVSRYFLPAGGRES